MNTHPFRSRLRAIEARIVTPAILICAALGGQAAAIECSSPGKQLTVLVRPDGAGQLEWTLKRGDATLIEPSRLGITVDGQHLGRGVTLGDARTTTIREEFDWRGIKKRATNHCVAMSIPVRHTASGAAWTLEVRTFDDGAAWRYRIPGQGNRQVTGEDSTWTLPAGAQTWFQTDTRNYEGAYTMARAEEIPTEVTEKDKKRPVHLGPPVTADLGRGGFVLISEANLFRYSGITLRPLGNRKLQADFEDDPKGFSLEGEIVTPWRVTIATKDLNGIVNSDVIPSLCAPPDPKLFPQGPYTPWIRAGRGLITWTVFGNDGAQWHRQKWFVDQCAAMKCEYLLVDGGWRTEKWGFLSGGADLWARLRELCDYAAGKNVGILVWNAYPDGRDDGPGLTRPEARREFFRRCQEAGVKGVKIDFFDSESKATLAVQEELLQLSAQHQLMINFHGAHKPTGEVRTWPHQVTQEGIREQEYLLWEQIPLPHYSALPFTRMAVGHSDFLPTYVHKKYLKNTTTAFQMATAVIATSSFHCWPDHPDEYLRSPLMPLIAVMPMVWDETIVLPGSEIGRFTAFARRAGKDWFVGVINSEEKTRNWTLDLGFLGKGNYEAMTCEDREPHPEGVAVKGGKAVQRGDRMKVSLAPGGGFAAWVKQR